MMARAEDDRALLNALSALAAERLPAVLAQAQEDAEERVRSILAEALATRMLELARHAGPDPGTIEGSDRTTGEVVYLLGITDSEALPADSPTLLERPLLTVHQAGLTAIVAEVPLAEFGEEDLRRNLEDLDWVERVARAHEGALEHLCEQLTVVPARLCTIYRSKQRTAEMLERELLPLTEAIGALHGRREWGLKVFQIAEPRGGPPADDPTTEPTTGAEYLRNRRRERDQRRNRLDEDAVAAERIHRGLSALAVDAVLNPLQRRELSGRDAEMVLNGSYLVERAREEEWLRRIGELASRDDHAGLELEPTGPWPAYNFVPDPIGAGR